MSRNDIANLAFKITGLYCLIQAIPFLRWTFEFRAYCFAVPWDYRSWLEALATLIPPALLVGLGSYLLRRSYPLAERMFPSSEPTVPPAAVTSVHALAFSIVGIWAVIDAAPCLIGRLLGIWVRHTQIRASGEYMPEVAFILPPVVMLGLGAALFFGSHRLVSVWRRLRYAGLINKLDVCRHCACDLSRNASGFCPECGAATPNTNDTSKK